MPGAGVPHVLLLVRVPVAVSVGRDRDVRHQLSQEAAVPAGHPPAPSSQRREPARDACDCGQRVCPQPHAAHGACREREGSCGVGGACRMSLKRRPQPARAARVRAAGRRRSPAPGPETPAGRRQVCRARLRARPTVPPQMQRQAAQVGPRAPSAAPTPPATRRRRRPRRRARTPRGAAPCSARCGGHPGRPLPQRDRTRNSLAPAHKRASCRARLYARRGRGRGGAAGTCAPRRNVASRS